MLIIGHRGAKGLEPENTIRSLTKAQELGVDMIEIDARLSSDNQIVLSHDRTLRRMFGVRGNIAKLTVSQIKELTQDQLPTLEEALQNISTPINIHVKVRGMEEQLLKIVKNFSSEVVISSTYLSVLKKIRTLDENIRLGWVIGEPELPFLPLLTRFSRLLNLYSIHPKSTLVSKFSNNLFKKANKKIIVWTVNDQQTHDRLSQLNIDGIITDYPNLFIKKV